MKKNVYRQPISDEETKLQGYPVRTTHEKLAEDAKAKFAEQSRRALPAEYEPEVKEPIKSREIADDQALSVNTTKETAASGQTSETTNTQDL